ncbi:putative small heat-shock protein [Cinnamomum micranthum f. kanehirae]|uniref:Putative small heat-shock protein n=1 Tax=Cinnamomum micranthum f. kanehirae TaxID=337451 RepID=A0A443Q356_9MAGN|nr:putative small heat-shock protein [Cinnamomum micranthum f. kanehirae]
MESEAMERRMSMIFSHLAGANEESVANHIFPMNCSSGINFVVPRCDNRILFARQSSLSQACFMRQVSVTQNYKEGALVREDLPLNCSSSEKSSCMTSEGPMFSRPVQTDSKLLNSREYQPLKQEREYDLSEPPNFARPNKGLPGRKPPFFKKIHTACSSGPEWSPRMDIAEFSRNYVVTVELPGIGINDTRVEVDDCNLVVTGKRSTQRWSVKNVSEDSNPKYLRREIMQGPYQVVWPLPNNVNRDGVSAEFIDGFLQVTLPKL